MAQSPLNDTPQPVDSEEEGRSSTMDRRWLIEKKKKRKKKQKKPDPVATAFVEIKQLDSLSMQIQKALQRGNTTLSMSSGSKV